MRAPLIYFFPGRKDLAPEWTERFSNNGTIQPGAYGPPEFDKTTRGLAAAPFQDKHIELSVENQNWHDLGEGVWLGIDKETFTPEAFQKLVKPKGEPVFLADGNPWIIPCCNADHSPDLPVSQKLTPVKLDKGGMPQLEMVNTLYSEYSDLAQFMEVLEKDFINSIIAEKNDELIINDLDMQIAITKALSINYNVDIRELSYAGVFGEEIYLDCLKQMLNYDEFLNHIKETLQNV